MQKSGIVHGKTRGQEVIDTKSITINPFNRTMYRGSRNIIEPNRRVDYKVLRTVAERAWIINAIIKHIIDSSRPFMKPSTDENVRGFQVRIKDRDRAPSAEEKKLSKMYEQFFNMTGFGDDPDREDSLTNFSAKVIRDVLTLDQVSTEIQRTAARKVYAMWAVDPATILKVNEEGYDGNDKIKYIQEVDMRVTAMYTRDDLVFDFMNPRTDIDHSGYGYSVVEQAIDLVTGTINSFMYNMGFFTEDKLPRGMLLLQGDADTEEVEMIEDYLVNIMSGGPASKWHVPIIPAGKGASGSPERKFEWVSLQGSNKDMEFSQWTEFLWSGIASLFGIDLEALGIRTSKSTSVLGDNATPRIESSKSRGLGSILGFLESHYQKILDKIDPKFDFEFVGYERDDPEAKTKLRESDLRTYKSMDELRSEADLKPFKQSWSMMPLNPVAVQIMQMEKQAQQMAQQGGAMGAPGSDQNGQDSYRDMLMGDDQDDGSQDKQGSIFDDDFEQPQKKSENELETNEKRMKNERPSIQKSMRLRPVIEITV